MRTYEAPIAVVLLVVGAMTLMFRIAHYLSGNPSHTLAANSLVVIGMIISTVLALVILWNRR